MIITNNLNLPRPFVEMARRDELQLAPNEYRVTSLLKGTREMLLERRHYEEITRDVADMVWLLFGTAVHSVLEHHTEEADELKENRLRLPFDGYILTGQFDLYRESAALLTDYKTASVWKIIHGDYSDWRRQLLIYAYMMRDIGFPVNSGQVVAYLKDHSKRDAKIKADYPRFPVHPVSFQFSDNDFMECEDFLHERFAEIKRCEALPDDELPICTPEERYNSGDKYAVMKKGRKTALRVLDSQGEAEQYMAEKGGDNIECRPGEDKKCLDYCACNQFCSYYRQHVKEDNHGNV